MRYSITHMLRRQNGAGRRRGIALPVIDTPVSLGAPLALAGVRIVRQWREWVAGTLMPLLAEPDPSLTFDATAEEVWRAIEEAKRTLGVIPEDQLALWASQVENWHTRRFIRAMQAGTGLNIELLIDRTGASAAVQSHLVWASSLISDVSATVARQVESLTLAAVANSTPRNELARDLMNVMGVQRRRAVRIARDQTMKLSGRLDQVRQQEAGIDQYKWIHSRKEHPRLHHVARNGKIFHWDEPPNDGHPRTQPNCGCTAQAWIDLLAD